MQELSFWLHHSYVPVLCTYNVPSFEDISIMTRKKKIPATFDAFRFFFFFFFFVKNLVHNSPQKESIKVNFNIVAAYDIVKVSEILFGNYTYLFANWEIGEEMTCYSTLTTKYLSRK